MRARAVLDVLDQTSAEHQRHRVLAVRHGWDLYLSRDQPERLYAAP
jgi:hypothetical protein